MISVRNILQYSLPFLPLIVGFLVGIPCPMKREVVTTEIKSYVPPGWMFATMWSIIYACLGGLIFMLLYKRVDDPIIWGLLIVNLLFNFTWTAMYSNSCFNNKILAFWWIVMSKLTLLALAARLLHKAPVQVLWLILYITWLDVALLLSYQSLKN